MKRTAVWVLAALVAGAGLGSGGARGEAPRRQRITVQIDGETLHLPNGMTFVLVKRPGAPTFAGYVGFRVGGVDSVPGDTGLAHMFEHMAFKGTRHIGTTDWARERPILEELQRVGDRLTRLQAEGKGTPQERAALARRRDELSAQEHQYIRKDAIDAWYTQAGERSMNASTGDDLTQYFVQLPANALELWALIESQRIREPVLREFYSERDVIAQERLMRTDNDPMGRLYEHFLATAFMAHPYRLPVIGWPSDIRALTMQGAEAFHHRYYSPSNAVGVLVGNFDVAQAKQLVLRYFGTIPRRGEAPPVVTREPRQEEERHVEVPFPANPQILMGWHKPTWPNVDDTRLDVVASILGDGLTARLYRRLVERDRVALAVDIDNGDPGVRYDNLFVVRVVPAPGAGLARVNAAIDDEIARLAREPLPAAELEKAKTRILASYLRRLDSNLSTATLLGSTALLTGDWRNLYKYLSDLQGVTAADVRTVTTSYLRRTNRTTAVLVRPAPSAVGSVP
ncbi:MAG TPA: pitrilysin family protein [Polyangia bacterium]|jgi:predicted Zn-dependent peptidase